MEIKQRVSRTRIEFLGCSVLGCRPWHLLRDGYGYLQALTGRFRLRDTCIDDIDIFIYLYIWLLILTDTYTDGHRFLQILIQMVIDTYRYLYRWL